MPVFLTLTLRSSFLVRAMSAIAKGASTRWWMSLLVMVHGVLLFVTVKVRPPRQLLD